MANTPNRDNARNPSYAPNVKPDATNPHGHPGSVRPTNVDAPDGENGTPDPNAPLPQTASKDEHEKSVG